MVRHEISRRFDVAKGVLVLSQADVGARADEEKRAIGFVVEGDGAGEGGKLVVGWHDDGGVGRAEGLGNGDAGDKV